MIHVTFAGHRNVFGGNVEQKIDEAIADILKRDTSFEFYSGGMGEFDSLCEAAVHRTKRVYKELDIKLIYVVPYMLNTLNTYKDYYEERYDEILIPGELEGVHYKAAITKRNRWLIDHSDYLIAYVFRDHGGAYNTLRYAQRKGCKIIRVE